MLKRSSIIYRIIRFIFTRFWVRFFRQWPSSQGWQVAFHSFYHLPALYFFCAKMQLGRLHRAWSCCHKTKKINPERGCPHSKLISIDESNI
jgi:hypothetical protein